jgi:Ca2+-binding RTX toxin-like protein
MKAVPRKAYRQGGNRHNTFTAGTGSLDVTGGGGADTYVFHADSGALTIEDFAVAKGDRLILDSGLQGSMQMASDGSGGTMLTFGSGHSVDLHGVASLPNSAITWV